MSHATTPADPIDALRGVADQVAAAWAALIDGMDPAHLEQLQAAMREGQRPGLLVIPASDPHPLTVRFVTADAQGRVRPFATVQAEAPAAARTLN